MDFGTNIRFPVYQMRPILVKVSLSMVKNLSVSEISIFIVLLRISVKREFLY